MPSAQRTRNVIGLIGAFVAMSMAGGVLAAGLAMPAVSATGMATKNSVTFFDSLPSELSQPPLSEKSKLLAADGTLITTFYDENRVLVPLKKISPFMQNAVIAIEDSRFYSHGGVDPEGIARAAVVNQITGSAAQGASTLTQQYVKNVLVESAFAKGDKKARQDAVDKSLARKVQEIRYAVSLEKKYKKPEILNRYLNIVSFGGTINGVEAAAKYYFHTTAAKLSLPQAATLAGMVQSPSAFNPKNNAKKATTRRNVVLKRMLDLKYIDRKAYDRAVASKLTTKITPSANGCANAKPVFGYPCEYVRRLITGSKEFSALGKTEEARRQSLHRGGLTIKTTFDPKLLRTSWKALSQKIPPKDASRLATAAVTVQPGTGHVLSLMQNRKYSPAGDKIRGEAALNYSVDNAYGGGNGFQTGSTFKPFTLAAWLDAGKSLNASLPAGPGVAQFREFRACGERLGGQDYPYGNSDDSTGSGDTMTAWDGTAKSVNGVFISMEKQLDLCKIRKIAEDIGVHLAKPRTDFCTEKKNDMTTRLPICAPSLTLGIADISPMTMAAAYAAFAAEGKFCKPVAVLSIKDRNGKDVKIPNGDCKQTLDRQVARGVNLGLSKALKPGGTAASVGPLPGRPASGKTGTTNDSIDTWFIGYTPQLATAVWTGDPKSYTRTDSQGNKYSARKSQNGRRVNGTYMAKVYGSKLAGPMWKTIMTAASKGMEVKTFASPSSKYTEAPQKEVPNVDGKSPDEAQSILEGAGFSVTKSNQPVGSGRPAGSVASTSPKGGSRASIGSTVTINISGGGGGGGGNGGGGNGGGGNGDGNGFPGFPGQ